MRAAPDTDRFVSVSDLAELTTLAPRTVRALLADGRLPSVRVGRRRLIPLREALGALRTAGDEPARSAVEAGAKR